MSNQDDTYRDDARRDDAHRDDMHDPLLAQLRAANPQPDDSLTELEQARSERALANILADDAPAADTPAAAASATDAPTADTTEPPVPHPRTQHWFRRPAYLTGAVAAVAALVTGIIVVPGLLNPNAPTATAEEILNQSAEAAQRQPDTTDLSVTSADYVRRVDSVGGSTPADASAAVTRTYQTNVGGATEVNVNKHGDLPPELAAIADHPEPRFPATELQALGTDKEALRGFLDQHWAGETAVGIVDLLLMPGLAGDQEAALYEILGTLEGSSVGTVEPSPTGGEDTLVTIIRDSDRMSFTIVPEKGQLTRVYGLVGPDVTTTVDAAGIIDCVNVAGVAGPDFISLACADNNYTVSELKWRNWGAPEAEGSGVAWLNNCDPDCARGEFGQFPVKVTAREKKRCGYNLDVYTKLDLDYGAAGADGRAPENETIEMQCL